MSDPTRPPQPGDEPPQQQQPPVYGNPPPPPQPAYGNQPPQQQPVYGTQPAHPGGLTSEELTWGGAAHWSALVATVIALAFLGPLIVMLTKGNESAYVRRQAVESLNFQLSILIYAVVSIVLLFVLIGFILLPVVGIAWLVFTIIGSVRAARGEEYRYPLTIRMVS
jgi:uncharacterized Tic20 family protein